MLVTYLTNCFVIQFKEAIDIKQIYRPATVNQAILKKLSVGGNRPGCNLEAPQKKFFQFFLIFTKLHFNDRCTQSDIESTIGAATAESYKN